MAVLAGNTLKHCNRCLRLRLKTSSESWKDQEAGYLEVGGSAPPQGEKLTSRTKTTMVTTFPVFSAEAPERMEAPTTDIDTKQETDETDGRRASELAPSFLDEEEYLEELKAAKHPPDTMNDCLWWLKSSHPVAQFFEFGSMFVIIVSVIGFVFETLPQYRLKEDGTARTEPLPAFFILESICIAWFTIEYLMRMYAAGPNRFRSWLWQPLNLVDLIAILPYYIGFALGSSDVSSIAIIRILRLLRVSRLLKFSRHSSGLQARQGEGVPLSCSRLFIAFSIMIGYDLLYHAHVTGACALLHHHACCLHPLWISHLLLRTGCRFRVYQHSRFVLFLSQAGRFLSFMDTVQRGSGGLS